MFYKFLKRQYQSGRITGAQLMRYVPKFISSEDAGKIMNGA